MREQVREIKPHSRAWVLALQAEARALEAEGRAAQELEAQARSIRQAAGLAMRSTIEEMMADRGHRLAPHEWPRMRITDDGPVVELVSRQEPPEVHRATKPENLEAADFVPAFEES